MHTWNDFTTASVNFAQARLRPVLKRRLAKTDGEAIPQDVAPKPDLLFSKIFGGYTEIVNTYEVMLDIGVYIRRFPFSGTRVRKTRYLQFHIEAYLHEVYILRERLVAYTAMVERLYRKTPRKSLAAEAASRAELAVRAALGSITDTRSSHVHQRRFSEKRLDDLTGTELVATYSDEEFWQTYLRWQYREVRREWVERIQDNNKAVEELLNMFSDILYPVLFDKEGNFITPRPVRA